MPNEARDRRSIPFVAGQRGVWIESRESPDRCVNIQQLTWQHEGSIDLEALREACRELARRHAALRLTVEEGDAGPEQWLENTIVIEPAVFARRVVESPFSPQRWDAICSDERRFVRAAREAPLWRLAVVRDRQDDDRLIWTFHHGLADGRSTWALVGEMHALYHAASASTHAGVQPWPAAAQSDLETASAALAAPASGARGFWRDLLAGASSPERCWPTSLARSGASDDRYLECKARLDPEATRRLRRWAEAHEITLNTALMTAWGLVLGCLTERQDVVFGTLRTCRTAEHDGAGFFANVVPMRVCFDPTEPAATVAIRVRRAWRSAGPYRSTPLHQVRDWAGAGALFHSVVAFETRPALVQIGRDDTASAAWNHFDLTRRPASRLLIYGFDGPELCLTIGFRTAWVDEDAAAGIASMLRATLHAMTANQVVARRATALGAVPRRQALRTGQGPEPSEPVPPTIDHALATIVASDPERVALVWHGGTLTYGALWATSGHLAGRLAYAGARPGDVVGLAAQRSAEMIAGQIAILRAGCAYLPIDLTDRPARQLAGLGRAGVTHILADDAGRRHVAEANVTLVGLDRVLLDGTETAEWTQPPRPTTGDELAYVMLTSGSTGRPKAVAVPHRAVVHLILASACARLGRDETLLHAAPPAFDASTFEIWGALLHGARLALMPPGAFSFTSLETALRTFRVTTLWLTSGLFHHVARECVDMLAGIEQLLVGGDVISPDDVATIRERFPACRLINGYGPTEATTFATCCDLTVPHPPTRTVPIGPPIGSTTTRVIDGRGRLLPAGLFGELLIGGPRLAWGYLTQPRLSAERFVPDPWSDQAGARLYRSGDRARFLRTGVIELAGRLDRQVKVRGFRVELDEVEAILQALPSIRTAVAVAEGDSASSRRLVAYVVPSTDDVDERTVRRALRARSAGYLVPQEIVFATELPMTPSGKLDRARLATGPRPRIRSSGSDSELTQIVAKLYRQILGRADVGLDDDFFDLGGDSIAAMRLAAQVEQRFGERVPAAWFFEQGRVRDLVARLEADTTPGRQPPVCEAEPEPRSGASAPPSQFQRQMAFLQDLTQSTAYNVPIAFRVRSALVPADLENALRALVSRHDVLRSRLIDRDGHLVRAIDPQWEGQLTLRDLGDASPEGRWHAALRVASEHRFDLSREHPLRVDLWRLDDGDWAVLFLFHHIAVDEITLASLFHELSKRNDLPVKASPDPAAFTRFCRDEHDGVFADRRTADLAYWRRIATVSRTLPELLGFPPTVHGASGIERQVVSLGDDFLALHDVLARRSRSSLFMLELALLGACVAIWADVRRLAFGVPISQRFASGHPGALGPMVGTVPLVLDVDLDAPFERHLAHVRDRLLEAIAHPWASLEDIAQACAVDRTDWGPSLFCALVTPVADRRDWWRLGETVAEPIPLPALAAKFPAAFYFHERGDAVDVEVTYPPGALDQTIVRTLVERLGSAAQRAAATPDGRLRTLFSPPSAQVSAMLERGRYTPSEPAPGETLPEIFRSIAELHADRPAVAWQDGQLTYRALRQRAAQVARGLRALGVSRGDSVGIAIERSPELIVGLLGILEAGGAYVPLDLEAPERRLEQMCVGAEARFVLLDGEPNEALGRLALRTLRLAQAEEAGAEVHTEQAPRLDPMDRAYVMHTSGSTGTPKPVAITHRGVVGLICGSGCASFGPDRVFLQMAILGFDASTFEIWGPLLHGGCLALLPPGMPTLDVLAATLRAHRVTTALLPTGLFHVLMQEGPEPLADLQQVLVGGDVLSSADADRFREAAPRVELVNAYGPTEVTVISTCCALSARPLGESSSPIGRPVGLTRILIVDRELVPVDLGAAGELVIGGPRLASGYLGMPGPTAERFVPDPHGPPGARLYRSGDMARWQADDTIAFLGRRDRQAKIRGFRVELDDVELGLGRCPGVAGAAVVTETTAGVRGLVAYVAPREGGNLRSDALRRDLENELPSFMIPQRIVLVERIALTPSGKLDRRALTPITDLEPRREPPANHLERSLAKMWGQLLSREEIGRDDDFFALGGTSLSLMRVLARVRADFEVDLPLRDVYRDPTLRTVAQAVRRRIRAPMLEAAEHHRGLDDASSIVLLAGDDHAGQVLLCVHPAGGHLLDYQLLARHLDAGGLTLFGVEAAGWSGGVTPSTVGELARGYLEQVRRRFLETVPIFMGYCTGGLVALEMAQQLAAEHASRPAAILLDTPPPPDPTRGGFRLDPVGAPNLIAAIFAGELRLDVSAEALSDVPREDLARTLWERFSEAFPRQAEDLGFETLARMYQTYFANLEATSRYVPRSERIDLVVLEAKESHRPTREDWQAHFPDATCRTVPGNHFSCMRPPHVDALATRLIEEVARRATVASPDAAPHTADKDKEPHVEP